MSEVTRRELLRRVAATIAAAGLVDRADAAAVHSLLQQSNSGAYTPKALSPHETRTLVRLTELIVPNETNSPGATEAEVVPWIDTLLSVNAELKARYTEGLAWLDAAMKSRGAADFSTAAPEQQTTLLDLIAYRRHRSAELDPGIDFFILVRRMTVDAYYTSPIGMRDVYQGNRPQAAFTVPAASMDHVLSRSPLK